MLAIISRQGRVASSYLISSQRIPTPIAVHDSLDGTVCEPLITDVQLTPSASLVACLAEWTLVKFRLVKFVSIWGPSLPLTLASLPVDLKPRDEGIAGQLANPPTQCAHP